MKKNHYHVIGLMSGTSLDGIDLAEIDFSIRSSDSAADNDFDPNWSFTIRNAETIAYPEDWKHQLKEAVSYSTAKLEKLDLEYTKFLSEVILKFIEKHSIGDLDAVCSHGHTILHQPQNGLTLQIGNLPDLAKLIQQKVVCDFRVQDVQLGGQGAPLVPIGDRLLFSDYDYCLNLGGFANVSSEENGKRIAYDICPVNIVLNKFAEKLGLPFDDKGNISKSGELNPVLLQKLNSLAYYSEKPPKSLGLEWVHREFLPILEEAFISDMDIMRTLTEHFAFQISKAFNNRTTVLLTGGGAYNDFLISRIRSLGDVDLVIPSDEIVEFKEALIFGLLGVLKLQEEVNCLASVTGAKIDHSSGNIFIV